MKWIAISVLCCASWAHAQGIGNVFMKHYPGAPGGGCSKNQIAQNDSNGDYYNCLAGAWNKVNGGSSSSVPSGMIAFMASGSCPAGWTELGHGTDYVLLTTAAAGDAGTTGGSNAYTPAGSNSTVAFTPTGTNSTSTVTPSGTLSWPAGVPTIAAGSFTQPTIAWPAGVPTIAAGVFTQPTISWPAGVPTQAADSFGTTKFTTSGSGTAAFTSETARGAISWPAGVPTNASGAFAEGAISWPAGVPTASSGAFSEGAISWPVGVPTFSGSSSTVGAQTFTGNSGTVPAQTFSGTPATLQPTYLKLIGCSKT